MKNMKIRNPEKFVDDWNKLRENTFSILENMKDTEETRVLKERLQKCDDAVELLEIATGVSLKAYQEIEERANRAGLSPSKLGEEKTPKKSFQKVEM